MDFTPRCYGLGHKVNFYRNLTGPVGLGPVGPPVGPSGAPIGHGFRASNNLFRGPCIKRLRNPAVEGSNGLVGLRWGVWWVPGGPGEARSVPVECLLTPALN